MTDSPINAPLLELEKMIGLNGQVPAGVKVHPDGEHLIYSVGCTVVIEKISTKEQELLSGHTNCITCIALSKSGRYLASGQLSPSGFKADIIIWDFQCRSLYCRLTLHRNKVEALAFSPNEKYIVSLGGEDDGTVVVWSLSNKTAICGSPAAVLSAGLTHTVCYANTSDDCFITGGSNTLRVWNLDVEHRKIRAADVAMGQLKRVVRCIEIDPDDSFFYCGTTTGDIIAVNMASKNFQAHGPKELFGLGVTAVTLMPNKDLLVGTGDGTIAVVKGKDANFKRTSKKAKVDGSVTSLAVRGVGHQFFVGTAVSQLYKFKYADFSFEMLFSGHCAPVNDLCFPRGFSDVLLTCSKEEIRLWNINKGEELLRIKVVNKICNAVDITPDGKTIVSGWDDGRIRCFYPESGKPKYIVENAGGGAVTALAVFNNNQKVIGGTSTGNLTIWELPATKVTKGTTYLDKFESLKQHRAQITHINIRKNDSECITSSRDGTCITWDLMTLVRIHMVRVNTLFMNVCFHPDEFQFITSGTDRRITFWEKYDASKIRELEGSKSGSVNSMDILENGHYFVSAGDDKLVKVWLYDEGNCTYIGVGHSAQIVGVKVAPNNRFIISISSDGAILKWKFPY